MNEQQAKDLQRRQSEDFRFMVLCHAKGNAAMYDLLRDKELDQYRKGTQLELFPFKK